MALAGITFLPDDVDAVALALFDSAFSGFGCEANCLILAKKLIKNVY